MIHMLRRNLNIKVLLFNNQIYGLTKGQFSPTSLLGQVTKSTPMGVIDLPFIPVSLALGAGATLVARTMDRDPKHLQEMVRRAETHHGSAFIEIYQNCNVFNDGAFFQFTEKETKDDNVVYLEHGKPLLFGKDSADGDPSERLHARGRRPEGREVLRKRSSRPQRERSQRLPSSWRT